MGRQVTRSLESFLSRRKIKDVDVWINQQKFENIDDLIFFCRSQNVEVDVEKYKLFFELAEIHQQNEINYAPVDDILDFEKPESHLESSFDELNDDKALDCNDQEQAEVSLENQEVQKLNLPSKTSYKKNKKKLI